MITIKINNQKVIVPNGTSILEACKQVGIDLPRFCYHETLSVAGNCRMCLVELEKSPKPIAACAMPVANNMAIFTETPLVKKARENIIEILLLNHPLDCPICDQGGECDLQDQTKAYGSDSTRFFFTKRSVEDKNLGPLIKTIMTRCIHCTRCVRFAAEIAGTNTLGTFKRGELTEIGTYLENIFNSEISGNVIDLCPVGALTSKPYSFKARPWELKKVASIDVFNNIGNNIQIQIKEAKIERILPKQSVAINKEFISDKIRFSHDSQINNRIENHFSKNKNKFEQKTLKEISMLLQKKKEKNILIFTQNTTDTESLLLLKNLSNQKNTHVKMITSEIKQNTSFKQAKINEINNADLCICFGTNLKVEAPILNIRVREQFLKGNFFLVNIGIPSISSISTSFLSLTNKAFIKLLNGKLMLQQIFGLCKEPFLFIGKTISLKFMLATALLKIFKINKNTNYFLIDASTNSQFAGFNKLKKINQFNIKWATTLIFPNVEETTFIKKISKIKPSVKASTHGSLWTAKSQIIIGLQTFFEEDLTFINLEGKIQKTNKMLTQSKNLQSKQFINLFNNAQSGYDKFMNELEIIYNSTLAKKNNKLINKLNKIADYIFCHPLKSNMEDFYLSNKFVKSSKTMAECSAKTRDSSNNFIQL